MAGEYKLKVFTSYMKGTNRSTFEIHVDTEEQANAHVQQILRDGYRRQLNQNTYDWISPRAIINVRVIGPSVSTGYQDTDITA